MNRSILKHVFGQAPARPPRRRLRVESLENRWMLAGDLVQPPVGGTFVQLNTNYGSIPVQLFDSVTPATVANFLKYTNDGDYTDSIFHRSVANFVIQGGGYKADGSLIPTDPAVVNEPFISNVAGTIAMAKLGGDPNSATSQFFFNLVDNSENLDNQNGGFTAFGRVVAHGMQTVQAIAAVPVGNIESVVISSVVVIAPPWQNNQSGANVHDVNGDGLVSPVDALILANRLLLNQAQEVTQEAVPFPTEGTEVAFYYDATGDNAVTREDALAVIAALQTPAAASQPLMVPDSSESTEASAPAFFAASDLTDNVSDDPALSSSFNTLSAASSVEPEAKDLTASAALGLLQTPASSLASSSALDTVATSTTDTSLLDQNALPTEMEFESSWAAPMLPSTSTSSTVNSKSTDDVLAGFESIAQLSLGQELTLLLAGSAA